MTNMLWLVPTIPLLGFLVLSIAGRFLPKVATALIGVGTVGLSALLSLGIGYEFWNNPQPVDQFLWNWISVEGLATSIGLYLDKLSTIMMLVITVVSFLILLYSAEFMANDKGYSRFFAYMNLFVGAMLILVLADNLLSLYLGWEGVGLCSYLLIGFWYEDPTNSRAANKAFIVTRIGDTLFTIGLLVLFWQFGTLALPQILSMAPQTWAVGNGMAVAATLLLLGGAVGKSAQLPLQTWLPDAMAGPTPVSALIHAATMVTAGVYLIARTHVLFDLAPQVQLLVALIGAITLLLAGCSALTQHDIKRVLAYSTMSQVGYMFLGLGVGAVDAAMFHFMVHAFFKSLLFLSAGVVILSLGQEHNMFRMGGLRTQMPFTFWVFLIGAVALSALPWIDAGFYSKDRILVLAYASPLGTWWLYLLGLIGSFITALYTFRMVFLTFFGTCQQKPQYRPGARMMIPLVLLSIGSLFGGLINIPQWLGNQQHIEKPLLEMAIALVTLCGLGLACIFYWLRPHLSTEWANNRICKAVSRWWFAGWGFDSLYTHLLVRPFALFFRWNKADCVDMVATYVGSISSGGHATLSRLQNGNVRWYAMTLTIGAIFVLSIMVWA
jgi:NADH-quinone oxidoreductase subunit L